VTEAGALFHIAEPADWEGADSHYRPASLEAEGFIHLSTAEQLEATTRRHYAGRADLRLLTIDRSRLGDLQLRWEEAPHGEIYPHLYGPLPVTAVSGVGPWPD
jgi:uncharacterized protein (DUF952 family)